MQASTPAADKLCCPIELSEAPRPLDVFTTTKTHIPLEEFTQVNCAACGHVDLATERRFFGVMRPRALQIVVGAIVLGIAAAGVFWR